ncbi:ankyrin repeat-containing domain protein [Cercophora newfieldiana]|uniref:Ankyrin repeat-containing domain protein n=1 Tax=Cercophora newfieldiana TaxID=92897 RepID=A0AA39YBX1_9PEZI|nr:ankyrin repeat-containing domain protein [Cercophora newfieldiana]
MAETDIAAPAQSRNERRKLQNRIAQRRFRQKRAMEARIAQDSQIESHWHDLGFTPDGDPATTTATFPSHEPPQLIGQSIPTWDSQLLVESFPLDPTMTTVNLAPVPTIPITSLSPPSSMLSSTSPGYPQPSQYTSTNTVSSDIAPSTTDAASTPFTPAVPTQAMFDLAAQLCAQARSEVAAEWKAAPTNPNPTWGGKDEPLLHTAVKNGNSDIVQMLINHNVDMNERNSRGMTALHVAIESQQPDAIMILLKNGVDVNAVDGEGRTALSMAVNNQCESGVRLLLLHGADPTVKGVSGGRSRVSS